MQCLQNVSSALLTIVLDLREIENPMDDIILVSSKMN